MLYRRLRRRLEAIRPRLFRTAFAWCRDRDLAEDLAQETLAKAMTKMDQLRAVDALEGWLFRIMANLWRDHVRQDRVFETVEDANIRTDESPEEINSQRETVYRVRNALDSLPESFRMVLTLVDLEGFSYAETSAILGVPVGTVMSRLSRGRLRLKKLLAQPDTSSAPQSGAPRVHQVK